MTEQEGVDRIDQFLRSIPDFDKSVQINVGEQVFHCGKPLSGDATADLTIGFAVAEDFMAMLENRLDPTMAALGGKMQISGDLTAAMQIQSALAGRRD